MESPQTKIRLLAYGPEAVQEHDIASIDEIDQWVGRGPVVWIDVEGLGDLEKLHALADRFQIHPLALEDVLTQHERAKVDTYAEHDFIVIRMLDIDNPRGTEQLGLFLGKGWVITFQERLGGDPFDEVRAHIRTASSPVRNAGPDYLAYALLDSVVGAYFPVIEAYGERLEILEDEVVTHPTSATLSRIHAAKRRLLRVRRAVWPLREALATLEREETPFIQATTRPYLRDLRDQTVQVADLVDTLRDLGASLTDLYVSSVSNRLNEVMKVLTIIATVFIPLSFITGVFGMNFDRAVSPWNMPLLGWKYGYPFALALMAVVAGGMLLYFGRKGWIGRGRAD